MLGGFKWASFGSSNSDTVTIIHIVLFFLLLIVIEGWYFKFKLMEVHFKDPKNTISRADFKKRVAGGE